jgi:hypothetical protein
MKKRTPTKLTVRRETVRTLAAIELARAIGGDEALPRESGAKMCPAPAAPAPANPLPTV